MNIDQPEGQEAIELVKRTLGNPLGPGELGALMARAGVGKTACLTHIALEQLFDSQPVLHVCIDGTAEKVKIWYRELIRNLPPPKDEFSKQQRHIESKRFILAYLHRTFSVPKLEQSLQNLKEQTGFHPALVVLDGLDLEREPRATLAELQDFAQRHRVSVWMSIKTHRHIAITNANGIPYPCNESDDLFHAILLLEPISKAIQVRVLKRDGQYQPEHPEVFLNPQSFLLQKS